MIEWKVFFVFGENGFLILKTTSTGADSNKLLDGDDNSLPYITRSDLNNGISGFVSRNNIIKFGKDDGRCITIGLDTQTAFYQPSEFITGQNIHVASSRYLNRFISLFLVTIIRNQMKLKFNWGGNGATLGRLQNLKAILPSVNDMLDYKYMETFVKNKHNAMLLKYRNYVENILQNISFRVIIPLNQCKMKSFEICKIFNIKSGEGLVKRKFTDGTIPFIGTTSYNNGITNFVSNPNKTLDKNILGVNCNGNVVDNFYHPYECIFSGDVKIFKLRNNKGNKFIYLFMKVMILSQKIKYSYSYKFNAKRMSNQKIMLPSTSEGEPDYEYMEQYTKNLMFKKYNQYLRYVDSKITKADSIMRYTSHFRSAL